MELIDLDCTFAMPSMPAKNGIDLKAEELYYLKLPTPKGNSTISEIKTLYKFSDYIQYSSDSAECSKTRETCVNSLITSLKDVSPFLLNSDSTVSKIEPLLYMVYKFIFILVTESLNVYHFLNIIFM